MMEVTWEERMSMIGRHVTDEEQAFHAAWATYNRSVGFGNSISVIDTRAIRLMRHFFQAGRQLSTPIPTFRRITT